MADISGTTKDPPPLPIQCIFCPELRLFRVTNYRGKGLSSGGFGVVLMSSSTGEDRGKKSTSRDSPHQATGSHEKEKDRETDFKSPSGIDTTEAEPTTKSVSHEYLFIEEVIFLYEQGKLQVDWGSINDDNNNNNGENMTTESSSFRLYSFLEPCGVSLAAYLVYAHLRSQTFRVRRHTSDRRRILKAMEVTRGLLKELVGCDNSADDREIENKSDNTGGDQDTENSANKECFHKERGTTGASDKTESRSNEENKEANSVRRQMSQLILSLREVEAKAPPPMVYQGGSATNTKGASIASSTPTIAFDVYEPNALFSRRSPDLPDIYVASTFYNAARSGSTLPSSLTFDQLQDLVRSAEGTPLRIAAVSDAGTVIMFGATDYGVPELHKM